MITYFVLQNHDLVWYQKYACLFSALLDPCSYRTDFFL